MERGYDRDARGNYPETPSAETKRTNRSIPRRLNLNVPERFGSAYQTEIQEQTSRYRHEPYSPVFQDQAPQPIGYVTPEYGRQSYDQPEEFQPFEEPEPPVEYGTGEISLFDDEPQEEYPSAYPEDEFSKVETPAPQTRPRTRKKIDRRALAERRASLLAVGVLSLCFFGMAVMMWVLPRSTESKIEKRELDKMPEFSLESYFSGDYTAGVAHYYTDTVPMRDNLKKIGSNIKSIFGLPQAEDSVKFVGKVNKVDKTGTVSAAQPDTRPIGSQPESGQPTAAPVGNPASPNLEGAAGRHMDNSTAPSENPFINQNADYTEQNGIIIVKQDGHYRGLELFSDFVGKDYSYADDLNSLHSQLGDGVQIWSMLAPLACEFYIPKNYEEYTANQSDCFDRVAAELDPGIRSINVCPVLSQHVEESIYCRTDHHWQPLGAYYAAQAFANAAGVPFDDISTYKKEVREGFVGSLYAFSDNSPELLNDPEEFVYYVPNKEYQAVYYDTSFNFIWDDDDFFQEGATGSDSYMVYLGGDQYIVRADTPTKNGRKLLVVKDSYGNALPPFLVGSFERIYVADVRYMQRNLISFIRDLGITDVLFTMTSYSLVGDAADNLGNLMSMNAGETVTDDYVPGAGGEG